MVRAADPCVAMGEVGRTTEAIAETIDGGSRGLLYSILACGTDGGWNEVVTNQKHAAYDPYRAGYKAGTLSASGIVIKVMQNLAWKAAHPGWQQDGDRGLIQS
jgi:hypothetical protein